MTALMEAYRYFSMANRELSYTPQSSGSFSKELRAVGEEMYKLRQKFNRKCLRGM